MIRLIIYGECDIFQMNYLDEFYNILLVFRKVYVGSHYC